MLVDACGTASPFRVVRCANHEICTQIVTASGGARWCQSCTWSLTFGNGSAVTFTFGNAKSLLVTLVPSGMLARWPFVSPYLWELWSYAARFNIILVPSGMSALWYFIIPSTLHFRECRLITRFTYIMFWHFAVFYLMSVTSFSSYWESWRYHSIYHGHLGSCMS
jgi:hypothetical protein